MAGKTLIDGQRPQTQCIDAVKALLAWKGRAADPLPSFVELGRGEARMVLVLSNKKDAYYTCTAKACSCPAAIYRHNGPCKYQRKYFTEAKASTKGTTSIMERKPFKPFLEDELRPAKAPASPLSVIDCHDGSDMDVAYHSIKLDREMWPMCEA